MPTNSTERTAARGRKGIKISERTKELYEQRDRSLEEDPETRPLRPEK